MKRYHRTLYGFLAAALVMGGLVLPPAVAGVGLMTKEELKSHLNDPDLMILDVRAGKDWKSSEFKIQGADHVKKGAYDEWAGSYPKDKKYVLYCA